MTSLQQSMSMVETQVPTDLLIAHIAKIHASISKLESLKPSEHVNSLFTQLVNLCILPSSVDTTSLPPNLQLMRESLISLSGRAEGLLELEFSTLLGKLPNPMDHLSIFPYYSNYLKLAILEHQILCQNGVVQPKRVAFVGSGPMPLTSIVLANQFMKSVQFDNYDLDKAANDAAWRLVAKDDDLGRRMRFKTCDIMDVREELAGFDCIFLAALVGMSKGEKAKVLGHIRKYMKSGGVMLVRSANGARGFLYPVVEEDDLHGFDVLSVFHPLDDVVNSIVLVRKALD